MINLIPSEEKEKMVKGFHYKLLVLFLLVLGTSVFIASIAILPAYYSSTTKNKLIDEKLETQKNEPIPLFDEKTLATVADLRKKLELIENVKENKFIVSEEIINAIILKKTPSIKITEIFYDSNPVEGKKISIRGTAQSREVLLLFRKSLEDIETFAKVDLPVSNFVRGSNIAFYMTLVPRSNAKVEPAL